MGYYAAAMTIVSSMLLAYWSIRSWQLFRTTMQEMNAILDSDLRRLQKLRELLRALLFPPSQMFFC